MAVTNDEYYIIVPKEARNLVYNPSVEVDHIGYASFGAGSLNRVGTQQRRGVYALGVTPSTGVQSGFYYTHTALVSSIGVMSFSVDVKGVAGQAMRIQVRDNAAAVLAEKTFTASGYWQRVELSYTDSGSAQRRLYVLRDAVASTSPFYVDGLQYEVGAPSTYLDGDLSGFVPGQTDYGWYGKPHNSQSWRSGKTRSGGTMLRIKDVARILLVLGLGMAPVFNIAQPTMADYSVFQDTRINDREIAFNLLFTGANPGEVKQKRQQLINAVRKDVTPVAQPLLIRYQGKDASGAETSEPVDILCHYSGGLQDGAQEPFIERATVTFTQYLPILRRDGENGVQLGYSSPISNPQNIIYQGPSGVWGGVGGGVTDAGSGLVRRLALSTDGSLFVGGLFSNAGSPSIGAKNIAIWKDNAWSAIGTGANGQVRALAAHADGSMIIGGDFTGLNGVANTGYIARYRNGAVTSMFWGTTALNGAVRAIAWHPQLKQFIVGGDFDSLGGGTAAGRIAYVSAFQLWGPLLSGFNGPVYAIAVAPNGDIYVGGSFTQDAAGLATYNGLAKLPMNGTWQPVGGGLGTAAQVETLAFGPDGKLYIGGTFTTGLGAPASYLVRWNGTAFERIATVSGPVSAIRRGPDGAMYIAAATNNVVNGISIPEGIFRLATDGTITPLGFDITVSGSVILDMTWTPDGGMYVGGAFENITALTPTALSATATVSNPGSVIAYPRFVIYGPSRVWKIVNETNKKGIYFNNLVLDPGERLVIITDPVNRKIVADSDSALINATRAPDVYKHILPGSSLELTLEPGANVISAFVTPADGVYDETGDNLNQVGSIALNNLNLTNTDSGKLYLTLTVSGGNISGVFYKDSPRTQAVAQFASSGSAGVKTVTQMNGSGIFGTITISLISATDSDIVLTLFGTVEMTWQSQFWSIDGAVR